MMKSNLSETNKSTYKSKSAQESISFIKFRPTKTLPPDREKSYKNKSKICCLIFILIGLFLLPISYKDLTSNFLSSEKGSDRNNNRQFLTRNFDYDYINLVVFIVPVLAGVLFVGFGVFYLVKNTPRSVFQNLPIAGRAKKSIPLNLEAQKCPIDTEFDDYIIV